MSLSGSGGKKPLIYYVIIVGVVLLLLNAFVFPSLLEYSVREVGYNDFLNMLEAGKISAVSRGDTQITFVASG